MTNLYIPCILNPESGHVDLAISNKPMPRIEAETLLKRKYPLKWLRCEALPRLSTLPRRIRSEFLINH
jgi:hypothetical protein